MNQYEASIARACLEYSGIQYFYDDNVPEDFMIPSLYFPTSEIDTNAVQLNGYNTKYSIYAKVFALTKREALELAEKIVQGIISNHCMLTIFNADGTKGTGLIKLETPSARVIDEGIAQITLSYRILRKCIETNKSPNANTIGVNKYYN